MIEEWRDIKGFEGSYQVSSLGNIRSLDRIDSRGNLLKGKMKKLELVWTGYLRASLKGKKIAVHRIVCESFLPNPNNLPQVNHINGVKKDNRVDNLEWISRSDNTKHAYQSGLLKKMYGSKNPMSKLTDIEREAIKKELKEQSNEYLSKKYGIQSSTISHIRKTTGSGKSPKKIKLSENNKKILMEVLFKKSIKSLREEFKVSTRYLGELRKENKK